MNRADKVKEEVKSGEYKRIQPNPAMLYMLVIHYLKVVDYEDEEYFYDVVPCAC